MPPGIVKEDSLKLTRSKKAKENKLEMEEAINKLQQEEWWTNMTEEKKPKPRKPRKPSESIDFPIQSQNNDFM